MHLLELITPITHAAGPATPTNVYAHHFLSAAQTSEALLVALVLAAVGYLLVERHTLLVLANALVTFFRKLREGSTFIQVETDKPLW